MDLVFLTMHVPQAPFKLNGINGQGVVFVAPITYVDRSSTKQTATVIF